MQFQQEADESTTGPASFVAALPDNLETTGAVEASGVRASRVGRGVKVPQLRLETAARCAPSSIPLAVSRLLSV